MKKLLIALALALSIGVSGSALAQQNWCGSAQEIATAVYLDRFTKGTPKYLYDDLIAQNRQKVSPQQVLQNKRVDFLQNIVDVVYAEATVRPRSEDIHVNAKLFGLVYFSVCREEGLQ